jgi:hypothetical protein
MSENKGLVVSNISGSDRGTIHSNAPLISITGAVSFARNADNNSHAMPGSDVFFHVAGIPDDDLTVSVFGGNHVVSGSSRIEGDAMIHGNVDVVGQFIVTGTSTLSGNVSIINDLDLSGNLEAMGTITVGDEIGVINIGDPSASGSDVLEIRSNSILRLSGSVQVPLDLNVTGSARFLNSVNANNTPAAIARMDESGTIINNWNFDSVSRTTDPGVYTVNLNVPSGTAVEDVVAFVNVGNETSGPRVLLPSVSVSGDVCSIVIRSFDLEGNAANVSLSVAVYLI